MIVIERRTSEHTDVTDVSGQRRMLQNRVESRPSLCNDDQLFTIFWVKEDGTGLTSRAGFDEWPK